MTKRSSRIKGNNHEKKLISRLVKSKNQEDEGFNFFFEDSLRDLRIIYGSKLDTVHGCLEILEGFCIASDGQIPPHQQYKLVYMQFEKIMGGLSEQNIDVSKYRALYRRLINMKSREYDSGDNLRDRKKTGVLESSISIERRAEINRIASKRTVSGQSSPTLVFHWNPSNYVYEVC